RSCEKTRMMRVPRWLVAGPGEKPEPSVRSALRETLAHLASNPKDPAFSALGSSAARRPASVVLDDGTGDAWTVRIEEDRLSVSAGRARDADTTITSDPLTLVGIVRGKRSGLEAFLRGRLRVRGNLSLALALDGLFDRRTLPTLLTRRSERARAHRVNAAGIDTFYLDAGSGPPVVLLHGLGATNASMLPTLVALAGRHRVLAPDLPGFGDSEKPIASYDARFFANWLATFLDRVGVDRAHVVGNSMGGRIAIELALTSPSRVRTLSLLAPSMAFRRFRHAVPLVKFLSPEMGALPLPLLAPHIHHGVRMLFARSSRLPSAWYDSAVDEFLRVFRTPRGRVALFAAARQIYLERPFGPTGFWSRLSRVTQPALFVWGDRDRMVPSGFARHVEETLPHAKSVVLQDSGHVPQFEHPELTHELISSFLADHAVDGAMRRAPG
ncbi:MAG TPA: alpha/beta fold hydrolase, partial [Polyangiaceae bacterium]